MKLFRFIQKASLVKEGPEGKIQELTIAPVREEVFESDQIVPIEKDGFIDTTDPKLIAKYKSNVSILLKKALEEGKVDKFFLIRDDDFFPYDWMWRATEGSVYGEYKKGDITYQLRKMEECFLF